jgi:hypothetical protein
VSMAHQQFLVLLLGSSNLWLIANISKWDRGLLQSQKYSLHGPCPILKLSVNVASPIVGLAS